MELSELFSKVKTVTPGEVRASLDDKPEGSYTLLDVREPAEYESGHLPGAVLIPLSQLPDRVGEIDPAKPVLVY